MQIKKFSTIARWIRCAVASRTRQNYWKSIVTKWLCINSLVSPLFQAFIIFYGYKWPFVVALVATIIHRSNWYCYGISKYSILKSTKRLSLMKGSRGAWEKNKAFDTKNLIFITSSCESIPVSKRHLWHSGENFEIPFVSSLFSDEADGNPFHMTFLFFLPHRISFKLCVMSSCWLQSP